MMEDIVNTKQEIADCEKNLKSSVKREEFN